MGAFQPYLQGAENFWTLPKYGEILFWGDKTKQVKERKPKESFISKYVKCIIRITKRSWKAFTGFRRLKSTNIQNAENSNRLCKYLHFDFVHVFAL